MKWLVFRQCALILLLISSCGVSAAETVGRNVVDLERMLPPVVRDILEDRSYDFQVSTGVKLKIVTLPFLNESINRETARNLLWEWNLAETPKGSVLVLISPKQHRVSIVLSKNLEDRLPPRLTGMIITRAMVPAFNDGNFVGGFNAMLDGFQHSLNGQGPELIRRLSNQSNFSVHEPLRYFLAFIVLSCTMMVFRIASSSLKVRAGAG